MGKRGKITIKYFLDKRQKPEESNGELVYPLYFKLIVKRQTSSIKSKYVKKLSEASLKNMKDIPDLTDPSDFTLAIINEKSLVNRLVSLMRPFERNDFGLGSFKNAYNEFFDLSNSLKFSTRLVYIKERFTDHNLEDLYEIIDWSLLKRDDRFFLSTLDSYLPIINEKFEDNLNYVIVQSFLYAIFIIDEIFKRIDKWPLNLKTGQILKKEQLFNSLPGIESSKNQSDRFISMKIDTGDNYLSKIVKKELLNMTIDSKHHSKVIRFTIDRIEKSLMKIYQGSSK